MRPITRITTAETNSAIPSYMILMYSQKTLFFIEDVIFVTVKSLNVAAAGRICGLHPPIIDTAFIKASFSQMIKLLKSLILLAP